VVLDFTDVTTIDITAIHAFENALERISHYPVYLLGVAPHVATKLVNSGILSAGNIALCPDASSLREHLAINNHNLASQESTPSTVSLYTADTGV
jgi:SulP family sulfate permease